MKTGLQKLFKTTNVITSIVKDRVFITRLPQDADENLDHILITQMSSEENKTLDGTSELRFIDFDIDCKSRTSTRVGTLATAVRTFLDDYTGPAGDQTIDAVLFGGEADDFEQPVSGDDKGLYVTTLDFNIQYKPV